MNIPPNVLNPTLNTPNRWWRFIALAAAVLLVLVGVFVGFHIFKRIPPAQAEEYLQTVLPDYQSLQAKLRFYQGGFVTTSKSVATSQEAFYEMSISRDYFSAVKDTTQDIKDIEATLELIDKAVAAKKAVPAPAELKELDAYLDTYYQAATSSLTTLLKHEKLQMAMLNASGDDLNLAVTRFDELVNKAIGAGLSHGEFEELISLLQKIGGLAEISLEKFENITDVPADEATYYAIQKDYHEDLSRSFWQTYVLLNTNPANWQKTLTTTLSGFAQRNADRQTARQADTKKWMETTHIKTDFAQMAELEPKITGFIADLFKKYDLSIQLTPTPSDSPSSSPSVLPSASPTGELAPSASPTVAPTSEVTAVPTPELSVTPAPSPSSSPTLEVSPQLSPQPSP